MISYEDGKEMAIPCKAKIEHFPSRSEVIQMLDEMISVNKFKKEYYCDNKDNSMTISFKDSHVAFEFMKLINTQKAKNAIYAKIRTSLFFDQKFSSTSGTSSQEKVAKSKAKINEGPKYLGTEPNEHHLKTKLLKKGYVLNQRSPLLISVPYVEPKTIVYAEYSKNKAKWISPNGFRKYVNPERSEILSEIGTYVTRSKADYTYKNFKYRDVNKTKWISNKNFTIKHLPDYI